MKQLIVLLLVTVLVLVYVLYRTGRQGVREGLQISGGAPRLVGAARHLRQLRRGAGRLTGGVVLAYASPHESRPLGELRLSAKNSLALDDASLARAEAELGGSWFVADAYSDAHSGAHSDAAREGFAPANYWECPPYASSRENFSGAAGATFSGREGMGGGGGDADGASRDWEDHLTADQRYCRAADAAALAARQPCDFEISAQPYAPDRPGTCEGPLCKKRDRSARVEAAALDSLQGLI